MLRWFNAETCHNALAIVSPGQAKDEALSPLTWPSSFRSLASAPCWLMPICETHRQQELFKLGNNAGLSGLLAGRIGTEAIARISLLPGLYVLPAGAVPPNPQELLGRPAFADLLQSLIRDFDIVIVDTPAANQYAESQVIAVGTSSALILARKIIAQ